MTILNFYAGGIFIIRLFSLLILFIQVYLLISILCKKSITSILLCNFFLNRLYSIPIIYTLQIMRNYYPFLIPQWMVSDEVFFMKHF